jgi:hypothetical protein
VVRLTVGSDGATGGEEELVGRLCAWWPEADARELVDLLFGFHARQRPPEWAKAQAADVGGIARSRRRVRRRFERGHLGNRPELARGRSGSL